MSETKIISIIIKNMKIEDNKFIIESDNSSYYTIIEKSAFEI